MINHCWHRRTMANFASTMDTDFTHRVYEHFLFNNVSLPLAETPAQQHYVNVFLEEHKIIENKKIAEKRSKSIMTATKMVVAGLVISFTILGLFIASYGKTFDSFAGSISSYRPMIKVITQWLYSGLKIKFGGDSDVNKIVDNMAYLRDDGFIGYTYLDTSVWVMLVILPLLGLSLGYVCNSIDDKWYKRHLQFLRLEFDTRLGMHSPR
eukprot:gene15216-32237_t